MIRDMGFDRQNILVQIEKNIPTECPDCFERLYFKGAGKYTCPRCHKIYYDYFGLIKKYLEENGFEIESAEFERIPNDTKEVTEEQRASIEKLLEKFEDDEDVQNVFHNMKEADDEE